MKTTDQNKSYKQLLDEYKHTTYIVPLSRNKAPHRLTDSDLELVSDKCFTKQSFKQLLLLKRIADATNASVGIKTHEARAIGHGCTYNNIPDRCAIINEKLKKAGFDFYLWAAKPANKKGTDDSWLWWVVKDVTTLSKGEAD